MEVRPKRDLVRFGHHFETVLLEIMSVISKEIGAVQTHRHLGHSVGEISAQARSAFLKGTSKRTALPYLRPLYPQCSAIGMAM